MDGRTPKYIDGYRRAVKPGTKMKNNKREDKESCTRYIQNIMAGKAVYGKNTSKSGFGLEVAEGTVIDD